MVETGNNVVQNFGLNPAVNFNFMLRVEGLFDLPCKSVHVFTKENEYEYIQEGGLNDYVHMRRKPISQPFTFQVERYVGVDGLLVDYLANGTELILPLILLVNRYHWDAAYPYPTRTYVFTGCTVMSKEYGELNAEKSGLLIETTKIAYREMINVDIGIGANSMNPIAINAPTTERVLSNGAKEWSASQMEKKANKMNALTKSSSYLTSETVKGRVVVKTELRKKDMAEKAKKNKMETIGSSFLTAETTKARVSLNKLEFRKAIMAARATRMKKATGEETTDIISESNGRVTVNTETRKQSMADRSRRWKPASYNKVPKAGSTGKVSWSFSSPEISRQDKRNSHEIRKVEMKKRRRVGIIKPNAIQVAQYLNR